MSREDKDSLVEMLAKIPVTETKGSLLSAIGKLLKVIDISESSIMIPTLLKDKCAFDAYEMLKLAKILKASILGHNDLVVYYFSESSSQFPNKSLAHHQQQLQQQLMLSNPYTPTINHINNNNNHINHSNNNINNNNNNNDKTNVYGGRHRHRNSISTNTSSSSSTGQHYHHHQNNHNHHQHNHMMTTLAHLNPIQQLSATPSLRSSASESTSSTPSTPMPNHAESIGSSNGGTSGGGLGGSGGGSGASNGLSAAGSSGSGNQLQMQQFQLGSNGDPDATVRLLLEIEHLKVFIPHVTGIFESIVELYKKSVDVTPEF